MPFKIFNHLLTNNCLTCYNAELKEGPIIIYGVENISQSICRNFWSSFSEMVKFCLFEEEHVHLSFVDEYKWKVKLQTFIDGTF